MRYKLPDELKFIENSRAVQKTSTVSMAGKVCVITGASSGVGLEAAKRLAQGGAHIVMVCRNPDKTEPIKQLIQAKWNVPVEIVQADFTRLDEVREAATVLLEKYPKIDVLINNAGLHLTKRTHTAEGFETVFCVIHLASFLLTQMLINRLKESAPARILMVNSEGHRFNGLDPEDLDWKKRIYTGLRSYGAAKSAQLLTVWEFADRLKNSGVTINAMHPGDVKTNIGNTNGPIYRFFLHNVIWHFLKDPVISGEAIYYLVSSPELNNVSGRFFHLTIEEKPAAHTRNRILGKRIWDLSMKMTGLQ